MELLTTKFKNKIKGILSCYDRVILQGTIPGICYAEGMTAYLYAKQIRIFDFYENAKQWRNQIILNVEKIAIKNGLKIEYIRKKNFRKETKNLREKIPQKNMGQISRILKRLRIHGIIKKIRNTYKYYLTKFGKQVISLGLKLKELYIIPALT